MLCSRAYINYYVLQCNESADPAMAALRESENPSMVNDIEHPWPITNLKSCS